MAGASQGAFAALAMGTTGATFAFPFNSIKDESEYGLVDNGERSVRGILDHIKERVEAGLQRFKFIIELDPSPADLDEILPLVGFTETANQFDPQESLTAFDVIMDRVAKVHTYADCYVDKAIFRGQKGNRPISLELHIMGKTMTEGNSGTFSPTNALTSDVVYTLCQGVLTIDGNTEVFDRFALVIDNHLEVQFNNSCTANAITPTQRTIHLAVSHPYTSDETALFTTPGPTRDVSGWGSSNLAFTNGAQSTTFTFANLKALATPPDIPGKREIRLAQTYKAYKSGSTDALVITHVDA